MPFSKSFPRTTDKSTYPIWEEVFLTDIEEKEQEVFARKENVILMKECLKDAKAIMEGQHLKDFQSDMIHLAIALFEKRASHQVYHKERLAKEKFDEQFG